MAERIIKQNATQGYIQEMARYAIVDNRRRMIPDVRDSFKPVQRKILYGMQELNAVSEGTKKKSARIVGDVMGKYHPHGDCLRGDTQIRLLSDEVLSIKQLCEAGEPVKILAVDVKTGKGVPAIAHSFRIGQYTDNVYHVIFSNGFELKCTSNHPIMMSDMSWTKTEDISIGDSIYATSTDNAVLVSDIWIEEVNKEPMYDFTVDGLENMLIPMDDKTMMCVHNSSIYGAMGNMTGWWRCKIPLINGWGNWGNFQGAKPAAMRYTEAYLSPFSNDCVLGLLKKYPSVVDWYSNFDGTTKEPAVLPTMIPLLLINGASGIGVGMKMDLPPHNVHEVIEVTRNLIRHPNAEVVLIPDLCMPCDIIDANWKKICNEGNGKFRVRGRIEVGEYKKSPALFIRSLPDGVTTDSIKTKLEEMTAKGIISQVKDILWEGSSTDMNLVIKLDKNADPYYFRDVVYKNTQAETSYSINFEAIHDLDHSRFSYKSYLEMYIINTKMTLFRMHCAKYHDAMTRSFELEAYIKVMNSGKIDEIYKAIRKNKSSDNTELIAWLCKLLSVTEFQAGFIIKAPLSKFSKGNLLAYQAEYNECVATAEENREYIINDDKITEELDQILADYDKKYGTPRICNVLKESDYSGVPKGTFKIVVTENNFIRKLQENDNVGIVKGDNPNFILKVDNTENILLFSNKGKVYKLPVSKIPLTDKGPGTDIRLLVKGLTSDIANVLYEPDLVKISKMKWKHYLVTVSAGNSIKKLEIEDFLAVPPSGIFYTKLNETDSVQDVQIIPDGLDLVIYSGHKALRCPLQEIPLYKRNAVGVAAMNTKDNIGGLSVLYQDITHICVVTKSGKINKFDAMGMPQAKRNQAGNSVIKLGTTDSIISIYGVNDNSTIRVITANSGSIDIAVRDIPSTSSISAGKKIISTKGDYIIKTKLYQS